MAQALVTGPQCPRRGAQRHAECIATPACSGCQTGDIHHLLDRWHSSPWRAPTNPSLGADRETSTWLLAGLWSSWQTGRGASLFLGKVHGTSGPAVGTRRLADRAAGIRSWAASWFRSGRQRGHSPEMSRARRLGPEAEGSGRSSVAWARNPAQICNCRLDRRRLPGTVPTPPLPPPRSHMVASDDTLDFVKSGFWKFWPASVSRWEEIGRLGPK